MFPLRQSNKLSSYMISFNPQQNHLISEDLIILNYNIASSDGGRDLNNISSTARSRSRQPRTLTNNPQNSTDHNERRKIHREIERHRRQEMATLFVSLRSLLPLEYIKGKRSKSDHMDEAVKYINQLKREIKELEAKKNEKLSNLSKLGCDINNNELDGNSNSAFSPSYFTISPSCGGIEILIRSTSNSTTDAALPLSRVLKVLLEEGLSIFRCISSKVNTNLVHTIQSEVCDFTCINQTELQQRLSQVNPSLRYMMSSE